MPRALRIELISTDEDAMFDIRGLARGLRYAGHAVSIAPVGGSRAGDEPDVRHFFGWPDETRTASNRPPAVVATVSADAPPTALAARTRGCDRIIVTSSSAARVFSAAGVVRDRLAVIPSGVDIERFRPAPDGPVLKTGPRTPQIVCVLHQLDVSHVVDLVVAMRRIPDARLLIAGGPPAARLRSDRGVREIAALARHTGVASRVVLLGDLPEATLPQLYRSADLVVATADSRGGRAALQAMACAVPVVGFAAGSLIDIISQNVSGLLVEPGSAAALADAVRAVLLSEPRRYGYAAAGLSRARERFSWNAIAEQLDTHYRAAIADHRSTGT
jgi:D-inositol-3-phosphate glycosyltransferase